MTSDTHARAQAGLAQRYREALEAVNDWADNHGWHTRACVDAEWDDDDPCFCGGDEVRESLYACFRDVLAAGPTAAAE